MAADSDEECPGQDPLPFDRPDVMVTGGGPWDLGPAAGPARFTGGEVPDGRKRRVANSDRQ
jgi:hypothetical protein